MQRMQNIIDEGHYQRSQGVRGHTPHCNVCGRSIQMIRDEGRTVRVDIRTGTEVSLDYKMTEQENIQQNLTCSVFFGRGVLFFVFVFRRNIFDQENKSRNGKGLWRIILTSLMLCTSAMVFGVECRTLHFLPTSFFQQGFRLNAAGDAELLNKSCKTLDRTCIKVQAVCISVEHIQLAVVNQNTMATKHVAT